MNSWYYSQANQAIGPFQMEVLSQLVQAGIISDTTPVKRAEETEWQPLGTVLPKDVPSSLPPSQNETRYYYLDATDQPVGPFDVIVLKRLYAENVLRPDTLVSGIGDTEWMPAARLLNLPVATSAAFRPAVDVAKTDSSPAGFDRFLGMIKKWAFAGQGHHLPDGSGISTAQTHFVSFEQFITMMVITLSFYSFYLVPLQSRDMKAITGRNRLEFRTLLIIGVVTLGFGILVMMVLWAYELERHGKTVNKTGRWQSLGTLVLVLCILARALPYAFEGFMVSFLIAALFSSCALWLLQREINLYATAPEVTT